MSRVVCLLPVVRSANPAGSQNGDPGLVPLPGSFSFLAFDCRGDHCAGSSQKSTGRARNTHPGGAALFFQPDQIVLAWVVIVAAFYEKPELLTGAQRHLQRGIEAVGDAIPPPWGPRIEFVFREIGGLASDRAAYLCTAHSPVVAFLAGIIFRRDRGL